MRRGGVSEVSSCRRSSEQGRRLTRNETRAVRDGELKSDGGGSFVVAANE
jgi:hypothetical protein